jgi:hypothetical protein
MHYIRIGDVVKTEKNGNDLNKADGWEFTGTEEWFEGSVTVNKFKRC